MIQRQLEPILRHYATQYPAIALLGPRQSGKTTLSQMAFPEYVYCSLEELDMRAYAQKDPRGFLEEYGKGPGLILDEIQHVPDLLSYMQSLIDQKKRPGFYILTGSQNFLLHDAITQSLAGRIAILTLLPLSIQELASVKKIPAEPETLMFQGSYPRVQAEGFERFNWYPNYIKTYIERDVRSIKNVSDLSQFQRFLKLCAGRIGQLVNLSSLANDCGITVPTAKSWLSLLEASYIVFLVQPYFQNFSKRLVKTPKLYFYDTGLACSLLEIMTQEQLQVHYLRGGLFESMMISELYKTKYNAAQEPHLYFWRDQTGHEVDIVTQDGNNIRSIEIKAGKTVQDDFFKEIKYWQTLSGQSPEYSFIVYGGNRSQQRSVGRVVPWDDVATVL